MRPTRHAALILLLAAVPAHAVDRWEAGPGDDGSAETRNELQHGTLQVHDFDPGSDQDWAVIVLQAGRSYEARASGGTVAWGPIPDGASCPDCARLDHVDQAGAVLTTGYVDSATAGLPAGYGYSASARWIAPSDAQQFIRATSGAQLGLSYDLQFVDTSYLIPRFNNSGTQQTVIVVQNASRFIVHAQVSFYNGAGTLVHSQPLVLPWRGNAVLNTATIPALQNVSGTAVLAHNAPYGTLSGKAVALEPATGFTFDTPLVPIPY